MSGWRKALPRKRAWLRCTSVDLRRFAAGEPLLHVVDKEKGY
jgi:hypothetical protein